MVIKDDAGSAHHRIHRRRAVIASTIGTTIEWYDFFLYGTIAALIFPSMFFPHSSPSTGVLESFSTLFVGFLARPVGAAIFGHYGDRVGRKAAFVTTLVMMGSATALIGLLPGFATVGVAAPLVLTTLRIVQGIGIGGAWGGSVLMSMEWGKARSRGLMGSWPQLGVPVGLLLSTGMVTVTAKLTGGDFESWGWRVPFLASIVLVALGLWVRLRVAESPEFTAAREQGSMPKLPVLTAIREHPREILTTAFVRLSEQAPFYLFITFVLTYGTKHLGLPRTELLRDTLIAAAIGLFTVPLAGYLSDRFGRRLIYGVGVVCTGLFAFPYFDLLDTRSSGVVLLAIIVSLVLHDVQYGPQGALIAESFGAGLRYSGAGLGYQLSSVIAGGPAPLIAAAILQQTGSSTGISWYIVGCSVLSLAALLLMPRRRSTSAEQSTSDVAVSKVA